VRQRADHVLVERGFFASRAQAQAAIAACCVFAAGVLIRRPAQRIAADAEISAVPAHPYVSRGGVKLAYALDDFGIAVVGRTVLDLGASTGGFTDVLLRRGATRVYAVDVGHGQLHPSLAADPRVISLERVDARRLDRGLVPEPIDLVVADVSFISLELVLAPALALAGGGGAELVALVKPQFEAGPSLVRRGGLVRDASVQAAVCDRVAAHVTRLGWSVRGLRPAVIEGGDGNQEFVLWAGRA